MGDHFRRRKILSFISIGLTTLIGWSEHVEAAALTGITTPYFQKTNSPLVIASPGYRLEDFEPTTPTLPILGVNLTTLHGSSIDPGLSVDGDDGSVDGSGAAGRSLTVTTQGGSTGAIFTFNNVTLGAYPKSAAIAVMSASASPLIFTVYDTTNTVSGIFSIPNISTSTPTGDDFLFWASDPTGIGSISVTSNNAATHLHLDHLQFDTVNSIPEPGTSALMIGATGILVLRRRKTMLQ